MAFQALPLVLTGLSGLAGLFGNRGDKQTSTYGVSPEMRPLQSVMLNQIMSRLRSNSLLPAGYREEQTKGINQTFENVGQNVRNSLTARGLASSPIAGAAEATLQTGRGGAIADMTSQIPMMEQALRQQELDRAIQMLGLGRESTTQTQGNMAGGAFGSIAQTLAYLMGSGAFGGGYGPAVPPGQRVGDVRY